MSFDGFVDDALALLWETHPVAASFAGETAYDAVLPPAGASAAASERARLDSLAERLACLAVPDLPGARLDARFVRAYVDQTRAELAERPRFDNPAWYTGEAIFGIVALLLRENVLRNDAALRARIAGIPDFLDAGSARVAERAVPPAWVERARTEAAALVRLLRDGLPLHPWAPFGRPLDVEPAVAAAQRFAAALAPVGDADPACGEPFLAALVRGVHGLRETPAELERRAETAFAATLASLEEAAARADPSRTWREQLARSGENVVRDAEALDEYRRWHVRALIDASPLLAPAAGYALRFTPLPAWARPFAADTYFLFYRSPQARAAGSGSTYWVDGAQSVSTIKLVHAVHHGSIGHHTQNAFARTVQSRFARIAGTDAASGIALLSAGTMVEGWACYAEDLMAEVPGFYTPAERMQLEYFTLRNIACCFADVRLHTRRWSLEDMRRFYRDDVAFAPGRIAAETTRNSIFPGSRLMYWTGTTQIAALRARSPLPARAFHDRLLSLGSAPVAWLAEELYA